MDQAQPILVCIIDSYSKTTTLREPPISLLLLVEKHPLLGWRPSVHYFHSWPTGRGN